MTYTGKYFGFGVGRNNTLSNHPWGFWFATWRPDPTLRRFQPKWWNTGCRLSVALLPFSINICNRNRPTWHWPMGV